MWRVLLALCAILAVLAGISIGYWSVRNTPPLPTLADGVWADGTSRLDGHITALDSSSNSMTFVAKNPYGNTATTTYTLLLMASTTFNGRSFSSPASLWAALPPLVGKNLTINARAAGDGSIGAESVHFAEHTQF